MKTITIISPVYNEAEVVRAFYIALKSELAKLKEYHTEIVFILDRSRDRTLEILKDIAANDSSVGVLALSARFGHQMSLRAGLDYADADAVIMMDSDLQHPPELISKLIEKYEKGADVVYTVRTDTIHVSRLHRSLSRLFYWFFNLISEVPIAGGVADFRLISRRVADVLRTQVHERNLFLRGLVPWMGFTQIAVPYVARERLAGKSKYSFRRMVQLGIFGVISFSKKPIRVAAILGILFIVAGFIGIIVISVLRFMLGRGVVDGMIVVFIMSFLSGVQLFFLGIVGEYIGGILDEVRRRPLYIVDETINLSRRNPQ